MPAPKVSIVICTRDRATDLRLTLRSVLASTIMADLPTELVVVDNGSTDNTALVVQEFQSDSMEIRYVVADRPGKGHAYNAGIRAATGEILLWTDDDVRVPSNWAKDMTRPIIEGRADAVAGGIVFPPHIVQALKQEPFASRQGWFASHEYLDAESPQAMIGANMAFHRRVLEKVPGFDVELGPGKLGFKDESLFSLQLKAAGFRLASNFGVAVEHHFDLRRATRAGLVATAHGMGRSYAFIFHHWEHQIYHLAGPRFVFALLRLQFARILDGIRSKGDMEASNYLLQMEETVAFCREIRVQSKRDRKYSLRGLAPLQTPGN